MKYVILAFFWVISISAHSFGILDKVYYFPFNIDRLVPFNEDSINSARDVNFKSSDFKKLLFIIDNATQLKNCDIYNQDNVRVKIIEDNLIIYIDKNGVAKIDKTLCKLVDKSKIDEVVNDK